MNNMKDYMKSKNKNVVVPQTAAPINRNQSTNRNFEQNKGQTIKFHDMPQNYQQSRPQSTGGRGFQQNQQQPHQNQRQSQSTNISSKFASVGNTQQQTQSRFQSPQNTVFSAQNHQSFNKGFQNDNSMATDNRNSFNHKSVPINQHTSNKFNAFIKPQQQQQQQQQQQHHQQTSFQQKDQQNPFNNKSTSNTFGNKHQFHPPSNSQQPNQSQPTWSKFQSVSANRSTPQFQQQTFNQGFSKQQPNSTVNQINWNQNQQQSFSNYSNNINANYQTTNNFPIKTNTPINKELLISKAANQDFSSFQSTNNSNRETNDENENENEEINEKISAADIKQLSNDYIDLPDENYPLITISEDFNSFEIPKLIYDQFELGRIPLNPFD